MKIVSKHILKAHLVPFLFSTLTLISVFLLQFLMKFADRLVGKGLGLIVIIKLIVYNLAWMVVLVVPMAVLIATLMAFGSMAQNNEIAIFKSAGISLYKMIIPPLLGSIFVAGLLIQFNNHIYPEANHAARILMQDISRKKPTLSLVPGVFSQEVRNYSILARDVKENSNELKTLTIYDNSNPADRNIITAKSGKLYFVAERKKLIMDLTEGEIHKAEVNNIKPYQKLVFEKHRIVMNADNFSFEQSSLSGSRGDRELGAPAMMKIVDSLKVKNIEYRKDFNSKLTKLLALHRSKSAVMNKTHSNLDYIYQRISDRINSANNSIRSSILRLKSSNESIGNYSVEIHKKYSIPVACIIFILIGAPLGTMTRKGGLGVAAGISLIFFTIYWAFLIGGEKLADRGLLSAFWGMWSANFVLGALGLFLLYKSAKERITLSFEWIKYLNPRNWRKSE